MKLIRSIAIIGLFVLGLSSARAGSNSLDAEQESSKPAFLGVETDPGTGPGVLVTRVVPKSAAETAGLRVGDRILGIAGKAIDSPDDLLTVLSKHAAAETVQLVFRRDGGICVVDTTLGERGSQRPKQLAKVLNVLRPQPGQVIADIGFGTGWLSEGLANAVGPEGLIYAVEISTSSVERMRARKIANIQVIHSKKDDVSLPDQSLDLAVLHDVASHVSKAERPAFYSSIQRALKSSGQLTIFGPHRRARSMLDELADYGFHADDEAALDQLSDKELDARLDGGIRFFYRRD